MLKNYYKSFSYRIPEKDLYKIIGVNPQSDKKDIKLAFYKKAKLYHPDCNNKEGNDEKFKEINMAYEILSNEEKKQSYDKSLGSRYSSTLNNSIKYRTKYNSENFNNDSGFHRNNSSFRTTNNSNYKNFNDYLKQNQNIKFKYYYRDETTGQLKMMSMDIKDEDIYRIQRQFYTKVDYEDYEKVSKMRILTSLISGLIFFSSFSIIIYVFIENLIYRKNQIQNQNPKKLSYHKTIFYPVDNDPIIQEFELRKKDIYYEERIRRKVNENNLFQENYKK